MTVKLFDGFLIAEGTELECAIYTHALIESIRMKQEFDKKQEVDEWLKKFGEMTFEELMKRERDDEE